MNPSPPKPQTDPLNPASARKEAAHFCSMLHIQDLEYPHDISQQHLQIAQRNKVLFVSGSLKSNTDQHQDKFLYGFCSVFACFSVTTFLALFFLAVFLYAVKVEAEFRNYESYAFYGTDSVFLSISPKTLLRLGANNAELVKTGELHRLLIAIFLHINLMHLIKNLIVTVLFVNWIEHTLGSWKTVIIFLVSGIGGNIFSIIAQDEDYLIKAGASTGIYGSFGFTFGYIFINWKGLEQIGNTLKYRAASIVALLFLTIIVASSWTASISNIDFYGHLGGFITGLWLASFHSTIRKGRREIILRLLFCMCLIGQFLACMFFLFEK